MLFAMYGSSTGAIVLIDLRAIFSPVSQYHLETTRAAGMVEAVETCEAVESVAVGAEVERSSGPATSTAPTTNLITPRLGA